MPTDESLSNREFSRLTQSVEKLTDTIDSLRREMAETYVRKDVYEADRKADALEEDSLSTRVGKMEGYWGRIAWTVCLLVLTALTSLVLVQNGGLRP